MQMKSMKKERPFLWQKFERHKNMPQAMFMCKITHQPTPDDSGMIFFLSCIPTLKSKPP